MSNRATVIVGDYRECELPTISGRTLFLGNPPYVRHHQIHAKWKTWLVDAVRSFGLDASQLAGLHVHFFVATTQYGKCGDIGILITAAEWLDVNYGRLVRELLLGPLGASEIHVIEPTANPFPGTATTAVITAFEIGSNRPSVGLRRVDTLDKLSPMQISWQVRRERLESAIRWSPLTRKPSKEREGFVELGELCRVHRGQVTGANRVWIGGAHSTHLPESVLYPSVTKAKELFAAGAVLADSRPLRRVIDIPADLGDLSDEDRKLVERFIRYAQSQGADNGFIARHRKAWWSVGLRRAAPILATYMARRPPAFVVNMASARHINIAHGLYPREHLSEEALTRLAHFLSNAISIDNGRTYAGGLTKFEPKEMERLLVPGPELLSQDALIDSLYAKSS